MKKQLLTKMLLMAVMLLGGANFAWGVADYHAFFIQNFEDENVPSSWTVSSTSEGSVSIVTCNGSKAVEGYCGTSGDRTLRFTPQGDDYTLFTTSDTYKFEFDWGTGGTSQNESYVKVQGVTNPQLLRIVIPAGKSSVSFYKPDGTTLLATDASNTDVSNRKLATATYLYHITIEGKKDDGVYVTVTHNSSTIVSETKILNTFDNVKGIENKMGKGYCHSDFDNVTFSKDLAPYKNRASDAVSVYTSINGNVMNTSVKSALDDAKDDLDAFADDDDIAADFSGYVDAIEALETANENAQTSINDFIILNDLITRANTFAETVTSYEAPEGASTVYTSNANVDPVALAAAVRAEVIEEGVKNDDTDITAIIINSEFELNSTLGWTIAGDAATATTDLDKYGATESNGSGGYQYYTGWNGRNISQIIPSLPAGKYRLTARVKSWSGGAPVRLFGNGTLSAAENGDDHTPTLEFTTTGNESNVKIGIGGTGNNNDTDNTWGTWGYKIDYFTLTYVGQDELALAKASLAEEIETATALYDSWTPKVGTTPFKYDATYYNALNTAIEAAQDVIDADGDVVSAYTSAEDALETAESNMALSTQNTPDPDKYYQIFVANNDGTASDYNLYMLKETTKTQVTVSAKPYPVKITKPDTRYRIVTPYGSYLCTDYSAVTTAYTNGWDGAKARCSEMQFVLNDNGSITIQGYRTSGTWFNYSASASEGAGVTANTGLTGKWVISDAVEVTDVNLAVNATTGWGTFIAPYENLIPSTVKAYTVSHKGSGYIYLEENETGLLSANTPYILSTEEVSNVSVAFKGIADNDEDTYEVNGLVGLLAAKTVPADSYILQYQAGKVGTAFYKLASDMTGTKYRCYLDLENVPASSGSRASVSMGIFDDETTGIHSIDNGKLTIDNYVYDLRGQRVAQPTKGLYIVNGKKVVIK